MKITLITACTKSKAYKPMLTVDDFPVKIESRESYANVCVPAVELYSGIQHKYIRKAVAIFRKQGYEVDWYILSAGYGLIAEREKIISYEATLIGKSEEAIRKWSDDMGIPDKLNSILIAAENPIFLLGREYMTALQVDKVGFKAVPTFVTNEHRYRTYGFTIPIAQSDCKMLGCTMTAAKGKFLLEVAEYIQRYPDRAADVFRDFNGFMERLRKRIRATNLFFKS